MASAKVTKTTKLVGNMKLDDTYPMDRPRLGYCYIINNVFEEFPKLRKEADDLAKTCKTIGFDVRVYNDQDEKKMTKIREEIMLKKTHEKSNCFMVCVIAHGGSKYITTKGEKDAHGKWRNHKKSWNLNDLVEGLDSVDTLISRPKIVIIEACQGGKGNKARKVVRTPSVESLSAGSSDEEPPYVHVAEGADFLLFYATIDGYLYYCAFAFVGRLAKKMKQYYKEGDLALICDEVKKEVMNEGINDGQGNILMVCPHLDSRLSVDLYFTDYKPKEGQEGTITDLSKGKVTGLSKK